jgi:hypothetical protein
MISCAFSFLWRVGEYCLTPDYPVIDRRRHLLFSKLRFRVLQGDGQHTLAHGLSDSELLPLLRAGPVTMLSIKVGRTKTDQTGETGAVLTAHAVPDCPACVCRQLQIHWVHELARGAPLASRALFCHSDGTPVNDTWFRAQLRIAFTGILDDEGVAFDLDFIVSHILRSAGSTSLVNCGASEVLIKVFARWRHDSIITYMRYAPSVFLGLHAAMWSSSFWRRS